MPNIKRIRVALTGAAVVGPGVNTFYVSSAATGFLPGVKDFYEAFKGSVPTGVTFVFPSGGETLDAATGAVVGVWNETPVLTTQGSDTNIYPAGVGGRVVWNTAGIRNRRRIRGATYIVPLSGGAYDLDGTLTAVARGRLVAGADALRAALLTDFVVWSRPHGAAGDGMASVVTSSDVPDKVSWLRSRRT